MAAAVVVEVKVIGLAIRRAAVKVGGALPPAVTVVAVAVESDEAEVRKAAKRLDLPFPVTLGTPELVRALVKAGHAVRCVTTEAATQFVAPLALQAVSGEPVRSALFDLGEESRIGHIELADWAELVIVAPATADLLAKMSLEQKVGHPSP